MVNHDRPPLLRLRRDDHEVVKTLSERERITYQEALHQLISTAAGTKPTFKVEPAEVARREGLVNQPATVSQPAPTSGPVSLSFAEITRLEAEEKAARIAAGQTGPRVLKNGFVILEPSEDPNSPRNARPQVPARDTPGHGLVVKPETMPGVNSTIESGTPSAPTDAEFTTAPPTPVGSNEPPAEQTPDYFGWRSEQAR